MLVYLLKLHKITFYNISYVSTDFTIISSTPAVTTTTFFSSEIKRSSWLCACGKRNEGYFILLLALHKTKRYDDDGRTAFHNSWHSY